MLIPKTRGLLLVTDYRETFLEFQEAFQFISGMDLDKEIINAAIEEFSNFDPNTFYFAIDISTVKLGPTKEGVTVEMATYRRFITLEEIAEICDISFELVVEAFTFYQEGKFEIEEVAVKTGLTELQLTTLSEYFESEDFDNPFDSDVDHSGY